MSRKRPEGVTESEWRKAGIALMIPALMGAGPIVGYFLGGALVRWIKPLAPWSDGVKFGCLILGLLAGIRESIKIIRRISRDDDQAK
jgi:hypothetical protein